MAVMTTVQKTSEGQDIFGKKQTKSHHKTRPITATLEHPLILDIKLLKKLDMTTFTKKGLIALSKFCGISLINKKDTKKKLGKIKTTVQYSKKQIGTECWEHSGTQFGECNKTYRTKRKFGKPIGKTKPRIRFKVAKEDSSPDEDSLDVVCKKHNKVSKTCTQLPSSRVDEKKYGRSIIDTILSGTIDNIIPEPCKTCSRSEQPERFHSHPKVLVKLPSGEKKLEEKFRDVLTTKDTGKEMKRNPCAKEKSFQESSCDEPQKNIPDKCNLTSKSPTKSSSSTEISSPERRNKVTSKALRKPPSFGTKSKTTTLEKANSKPEVSQKGEKVIPREEALKFVTGCYICGKQVSPELRIKHEETCILEWRTRNSLVSPDKRKAEPKRPDYRFTATGELDCQGTFESIWANHMDSLVPCKKCGRKFFPDRIERHENCCNNLPISIKYKH